VRKRLQKIAKEKFQGHYSRLDVRFRGQFCYIDAFTEPKINPDWPETREEYA